ncbi:MAG TPA: DUF427 domain-containing protein [Rhizomicrobium sp.]|nr:DUF427 domain-containing protein [Rhizomicrobium sp.]
MITGKPIRVPGRDHPITIVPQPGRVVVRTGEEIIADTRAALRLAEASYPPVFYIPRTDAKMSWLAPSDHRTYCPYKGACSYFSIASGGEAGRNAVWSYEDPYPAVAAIKDHLAFYPDRVRIETT